MAQREKTFGTESDNLSLIPASHIVGETQLLEDVLCPPHMLWQYT